MNSLDKFEEGGLYLGNEKVGNITEPSYQYGLTGTKSRQETEDYIREGDTITIKKDGVYTIGSGTYEVKSVSESNEARRVGMSKVFGLSYGIGKTSSKNPPSKLNKRRLAKKFAKAWENKHKRGKCGR